MAIFSFGKDKADPEALNQVLAYLEEALRSRSPFTVADERGQETAAQLHSVSEEGRSFRLLPRDGLNWAKGGRTAFTFILDGLRVGGSGRTVEAIPGVLTLQLPDGLAVMERRAAPGRG